MCVQRLWSRRLDRSDPSPTAENEHRLISRASQGEVALPSISFFTAVDQLTQDPSGRRATVSPITTWHRVHTRTFHPKDPQFEKRDGAKTAAIATASPPNGPVSRKSCYPFYDRTSIFPLENSRADRLFSSCKLEIQERNTPPCIFSAGQGCFSAVSSLVQARKFMRK